MPGKRSTKIEINAKVAKIYTLILNGLKRRDILQYASENSWNLSERMIDEYIRRAMEIHMDQSREDFDYAKAVSLNRHDNLYFRSMAINDFKTALAVQKSRDEITGVKTAYKVEVTGKDGGPIQHKVLNVKEEVEKLVSLIPDVIVLSEGDDRPISGNGSE